MGQIGKRVWQAISGMCTFGSLISFARYVVSPNPEMIGSFSISAGLMQSIWLVASLVFAGICLVLSREYFFGFSKAHRFAAMHDQLLAELDAMESDKAMGENLSRSVEVRWSRRESVCVTLHKLGITCPDPITKDETWRWFLAQMVAFSKDRRYMEAKNVNMDVMQWSPATHLSGSERE